MDSERPFYPGGQIESRLVRSMRRDLTKTAPVVTELDRIQNKVFRAPSPHNLQHRNLDRKGVRASESLL